MKIFIFSAIIIFFTLLFSPFNMQAGAQSLGGKGPAKDDKLDSIEAIDKIEAHIAALEKQKKQYTASGITIIVSAIDRLLTAYKDYKDARELRSKPEIRKTWKEVKDARAALKELLPKDDNNKNKSSAKDTSSKDSASAKNK